MRLYTSPTCAPCRVIKNELGRTDLAVEIIDITDRANEELVISKGIRSTPTFEINGELHRVSTFNQIQNLI